MEKNNVDIKKIFDLWLGKNPIILFDTSSIIEIENRRRIEHKNAAPILEFMASYYPVIITDEVMKEVETHNNTFLSRNRKEISDHTYRVIKLLNKNSKYIENLLNKPEEDEIRYKAYWICKEIEKEELEERKKKGCISNCDYKLISKAGIYSISEIYIDQEIGFEPISRVLVFSEDHHIKKGLEKMLEEGYEKIFYINFNSTPLVNLK